MPEIATAWVTLSATTRGMESDIRRAVDRAGRNARINTQVDTRGIDRDVRRAMERASNNARITPTLDASDLEEAGGAAGEGFGESFVDAAKTAMKALAAATIGAGVIDQFRRILDVGTDWTNNMNTLQAVSGATAEQLAAAGTAARALGNDISLPATSANDASAAMTELAKGGFTVQQSMDAAKGSLQLAAAAQIGAADAATIQSQALQAFGLQAGDAGKIADTLANAANASSAEITDVASALAQAGTVANQFGLTAEDTAAAIALLANNGIQGSDAGTLLKSALLALTDQGNPAQGAIEELGLSVYDAQGKFVGLSQLFGELGQASTRMTAEQYQAATAVLFGSDAMRLAGVAAKDGSQSYDAMRVAIDRQGAAADVASAKTKGLPGAWERVKNAIESLQLQAYDTLQGPLTSVADKMSESLGRVGPAVESAVRQIGANPIISSTFRDMVNAFQGIVGAGQEMLPSLAAIGKSLGIAAAAVGIGTWKLFVVALQSAAGVLNSLEPLLSTIADLMTAHQGAVIAAAAAWVAFKTIPALMTRLSTAVAPVGAAVQTMGQRFQAARTNVTNFGSAYSTYMGYLRQANPTMSTATQHIRTLGSVASGAASGGLAALKRGASGVIGALGGPMSAALIAATAGITLWATSAGDAQRRTRDLAAAQGELNATSKELWDLLTATGGNVDENIIAKATDQFNALNKQFDTLRSGASIGDWLRGGGSDFFGLGDFDIGDALDKQNTAEKIERIKQAMNDLGTTSQSMGVLISGSSEAWVQFTQNAQAAGDGGRELLAEMQPLRQAFLDSQGAAKLLTPGLGSVRDAIKAIADESSTADEKTRAFKSALDALAGVTPDAQEATAQYNETIRNLAELEVAPEDLQKTPITRNADGSVDTKSETGAQFYEALKQIKAGTEGVAGSTNDMKVLQDTLAQSDVALQKLADKFGVTKAEADAYAASIGYIPRQFETLFEMKGATEAAQQLGLVKTELLTVPQNTPITMDAASVTSAKDELIKTGAKLREFDGPGGRKMIEITAPNGQVLDNIDAVIRKLGQVPTTLPVKFTTFGENFNPAAPDQGPAPGAQRERLGRNANGSIVPMANGGLSLQQIIKPSDAGLYAGRGAGTIFAEQETGGEAYIPLAPGKRKRSMAILAEVMRLFGIGNFEDGGITVDSLRAYASQIQGGSYVRGGPPGLSGTDCSGAQAAIANYITGGGGRFGTASEGQALTSRGFMEGDPPPGVAAYWIGWKNGGPGGGHTAGTIVDPTGGNVNVEMGGANGGGAFGAGAAGASEFPNRAWIQIAGGEDPNAPDSFGGSSAAVQRATAGVTSAKAGVTSAQATLDQANAAVSEAKSKGASADKIAALEKKRDAAEQKLTAAQERQTAAETKLTEVKEKAADGAEKGGLDGKSLGQTFLSGIFETLGVPNFSNFTEWPNFKSGAALLNYGAGLLGGAAGSDQAAGGDPTGVLPALGLPNLANALTPQTVTPNAPAPGSVAAGAQGPQFIINGNVGMDPKAVTQKFAHASDQNWRRNLGSVRPG